MPGHPSNPLTPEALRAKFDECAGLVLTPDRVRSVGQMVKEPRRVPRRAEPHRHPRTGLSHAPFARRNRGPTASPIMRAPPSYVTVWLLLVLAWAANFTIRIGFSALLPLIIADLGLSYTLAGVLAGAFFWAYMAMQIPAGLLGDRFGRRRVLLLGLVGGACACALTGMAGLLGDARARARLDGRLSGVTVLERSRDHRRRHAG